MLLKRFCSCTAFISCDQTWNHAAVHCDCVSVARAEQRGSWELASIVFVFCQCVWAADGRGGQQHAVVGDAVWEEQGECVSVGSRVWLPESGVLWLESLLWRSRPPLKYDWFMTQCVIINICVYSLWTFSLWRTSRVMSLHTHGVIHLSWVQRFDKFRNAEKRWYRCRVFVGEDIITYNFEDIKLCKMYIIVFK